MKRFKQAAGLFFMGGLGYPILEVLWRGYSHWTMALTGGIAFVGLGRLDRCMKGRGMAARCTAGAAWVTGLELLVGMGINMGLHMDVWDYSSEWGNLWGQICPKYAAIWFMLCGPAMALAGRSAKLLAKPGRRGYNGSGTEIVED